MSDTVKEAINCFKQAGDIVKIIKKNLIPNIIKPGQNILNIVNKIEEEIIKNNAQPAFPTNVAIDYIAAHYTPIEEKDRDVVIPSDKIIKIDFGTHINGYPVDNAISFYFGDDDDIRVMIETAREAFYRAIEIIKPGIELTQIGQVIEDYVNERGYKVIENLNGHKLDRYVLHGDKELPVSSKTKTPGKIEKNEVYAMEIFVTKGAGWAKAIDDIRIYSVIEQLPKRLPIHLKSARVILSEIIKERKSLPFTPRWLLKKFSYPEVKIAMVSLERAGVIVPYPVLVEKENKSIAQYEETILITDEGAKIIT